MDYIFTIGLIPVQEFIAEARRSRDLRTGSAMLSWFMAKTLNDICNSMLKAKIIIPEDKNPPTVKEIAEESISDVVNNVDYSIPNRASGYCKAQNDDELSKIFHEITKTNLLSIWKKWLKDFLKAENILDEKRDNKGIIEEFDKYLSFFKSDDYPMPVRMIWAAQKVDSRNLNGDNLKENLEAINTFYEGIKRTRTIESLPGGAPIGKCTQCGKREAVGPMDSFKEWRKFYADLAKVHSVKMGYRIEKSERLCHVCLLKRVVSYAVEGREEARFPSTNEIAIRKWLSELKLSEYWSDECKQQLNEWKKNLLDNWPLVFYKRDKNRLKKILADLNKHDNETVKLDAFQNKIIDIAKNAGISSTPPNYLAIFIFDGDDMGMHVQEFPADIPKKLKSFSKEILLLCAKLQAKPFYLGGDEGIILSPISEVLELADEIQSKFSAQFKNINSEITLSCGITIFDRNRPLGPAISQTFTCLAEAKDFENKNALSIGVQTASGSIWSFSAHWGMDWERIKILLENIKNKKISISSVYDIERFLRSLPPEILNRAGMEKPLLAEMKRILWRKFATDDKGEAKKTAFLNLWNSLKEESWFESLDNEIDFGTWANQFHLIGFLSGQRVHRTGKD